MRFYNTLTRDRREFTPIGISEVKIYSCGPTVYGAAHIGNLRTYIFMDELRRALLWNEYDLIHVMNITDVGHLINDGDDGEDKMAKTAREQSKSPWQIASYYTDMFLKDIDRLNIGRPEIICKATDHIPEMIKFVEGLFEKGFAYETSDGIYFDIGKLPDYGKLSRINLDDLLAGARVEVNAEKRHPADFALWKKAAPEHIMQWKSPWGMGYPGWHIECSAMGLKYLGKKFDIHTGGVDAIPIHHENEIAQAEGLFGHPAADIWMHGEFMLVDNGKMSKSLGNTYTIDQLIERGYDPLDFRYFCLNAHYRSKLNFTFEGMDSAKVSLKNLRMAVQAHKGANGLVSDSEIKALRDLFSSAVNDDINIPRALGFAWNVAKMRKKSNKYYKLLMEYDRVFALDLDKPLPADEPAEIEVDAALEAMIKARTDAKKAKNFAEADRIRDELKAQGIVLIDTPVGVKVQRVSE